MQVVVGSNPHGGELVVESGRGGARRVGAGRGAVGSVGGLWESSIFFEKKMT